MPATPNQITDEQAAEAYALAMNTWTLLGLARRYSTTCRAVRSGVARHAVRNGLNEPTWHATQGRRQPFNTPTATADVAEAIVTATAGTLPGRTFGVEIEFRRPNGRTYGPNELTPEMIAAALRAGGVNCQAENYNHSVRPHWKLIHDASSDRELVSPILSGPEGLAEVKAAMKVLRELGCKVTRSEGMHVHVYVGDATPTAVAAAFRFYADRQQTVFDRLNAPARRGHRAQYCGPVSNADATRVETYARRGTVSAPGNRYLTVNLQAFSRYGTIEYRQHAGTLNGTKATAWIEMLLAVTQFAADGRTCDDTTLEGTLTALKAAGVLAPRTADRLVRKARDYGFTVGDLDPTPPAATPAPAPEPEPEPAVEQAAAWANCDCLVCRSARDRAAANTNVNLTVIGA